MKLPLKHLKHECRQMLMVALFLVGFIFEFLVELPFRVILALGGRRPPGT